MRMRKMKNLIPRMQRCQAQLVLRPDTMRGKWAQTLMPGAAEVHIEIGCGKGRFICETARAHPDILYIGIERVPEALVGAMEKAMEQKLPNVFFTEADAAMIDEHFSGEEVQRIYLNFSDPWPKTRHHKRRLTHEGFLNKYRAVLGTGGQIHMKTDNRPLFDFSLEQFKACGFSVSELTYDRHAGGIRGIMTEYEEKFVQNGIKINRCVAQMQALPAADKKEPEV